MHPIRRASDVAISLAFSAYLLLSASAGSAAAPAQPAYARVALSPSAAVNVEFRGAEMRVARTAQGLQTAAPVKGSRSVGRWVEFPEVTLPFAAASLPPRVAKITTRFEVMQPPERSSRGGAPVGYVFATIGLCYQDSAGALWTYVTRASAQTATSLVRARPIEVPRLGALTMTVVTRAYRKRIGAGIRVASGKVELSEIRKDGRSVEAQLRLLDSAGGAVATARGPLAKFGFT